jgi:hypothetical protein
VLLINGLTSEEGHSLARAIELFLRWGPQWLGGREQESVARRFAGHETRRHCRVEGQEALKPPSDVDGPEDRCGPGYARPIPT